VSTLLEVSHLNAGYGSAQVLFDVSLALREGEVCALMGRNGAGKSTLVKSLLGVDGWRTGELRMAGQDLVRLPAYRGARSGIGMVPEGRHIFRDLTVHENLVATARRGVWTPERVYDLFPRLIERRAHRGDQLSGGEQQMLAIGRALMTQPRMLVLDEATEGLAPLIRMQIWRTLKRLKTEGLAMLVVDRDLAALSSLADQFLVLQKGAVALSGAGEGLAARAHEVERLVTV
jgi:branched-chain amino acid transport system ATP-binding protein